MNFIYLFKNCTNSRKTCISQRFDNLLTFFFRGVEAIVVDYVRPVVFGEAIPKIARMLVFLISAFTLGGLLYFNMNDVGIARAVRRFWSIKQ